MRLFNDFDKWLRGPNIEFMRFILFLWLAGFVLSLSRGELRWQFVAITFVVVLLNGLSHRQGIEDGWEVFHEQLEKMSKEQLEKIVKEHPHE
jgi:hypothetical protein